MIVYKVVRPTNRHGIYKSFIAEGKAKVTYSLNKRAYAPRWLSREGNYLCVFDSLDMAYDFAIVFFHKKYVIFECEARTICKKLVSTCSLPRLAYGEINPFCVDDWPKGTVMVKTLVPVREINRKD